MTLPLFIGNIPDGTALQVLGWINNGFASAFSQSASPTPPTDPIQCQPWVNSATGIAYVRDPQNTAWVPIGRFDSQSWIPIMASGAGDGGSTGGGGQQDDPGDTVTLGPYATLAAGEGFAAGSNGSVSVRQIRVSDLPVLSGTSAGIVPAPGGANAGGVLRPNGWSPLLQNLGRKQITGSTAVFSSIPPFQTLKGFGYAVVPTNQTLLIQIGSTGAPQTSGYDGSVNALPSDSRETNSNGFRLLIDKVGDNTIPIHFTFEVLESDNNNEYYCQSFARQVGDRYTFHGLGTVNLSGRLNYLRLASSGGGSISGGMKLIGG